MLPLIGEDVWLIKFTIVNNNYTVVVEYGLN